MFHDDEQQERLIYDEQDPKRRSSISIVWLILLALMAGLFGSGLTYFLFQKNHAEDNLEGSPKVIIQSVEENISAARSDDEVLSIAEKVAESASAFVVEVTTESKTTHPFWGSYITEGAGSGVVISADGYIVTNQHVVEGSTNIVVKLNDGSEAHAMVIGADTHSDLAVIKIEKEELQAAVFADSDQVRVGETVIAIGNPLGTLGGSVTEGIISAKDREIVIGEEVMRLLQTTAAINPGNSGGGLFNKDSELVGVVNAKSSGNDIEGLGFAIPSNTAQKVVSDIIEKGYVTGRPWIGAEMVEVTSFNDLYRYGVREYGVYIYSSIADSPLQRGDMILQIEGQEVSTISAVNALISQYTVGQEVRIVVRRGNKDEEILVELKEMGRGPI